MRISDWSSDVCSSDLHAELWEGSRMPQSRISSWSGPFASLGPDDRSVVTQLVLSGGAVVATSMQIAERLGRARPIALLRSQGTDRIIGVASLKETDRQSTRLNSSP